MTIAITQTAVAPSIELGLDASLESELLDAAHASLRASFESASLIVRVLDGTERSPGLVHVILVDPEIAPDGSALLTLQVVHLDPRARNQVIVTHLEMPEAERAQGKALGLVGALYRVCADRGAALLLMGLSDIGCGRLLKRGAHRIEQGVVQIIGATRLNG